MLETLKVEGLICKHVLRLAGNEKPPVAILTSKKALLKCTSIFCTVVLSIFAVDARQAPADNVIAATTGADQYNNAAILTSIEGQIQENGASLPLYRTLAGIVHNQPGNARAHFLLGRLYERSGYEALARDEFELADKLSPKDADALLAQTVEKIEHNDLPGARRLLNYAAAHFPEAVQTRTMEALCLAASRQDDKAEKLLEKVLESPSAPAVAAMTLATIKIRHGKYQQALSLAESKPLSDDQSGQADLTKGLALSGLGRKDEAIRLLSPAFTADPLNPVLALALARLFTLKDMPGQALCPALVSLGTSQDAQSRQQVAAMAKKLLSAVPAGEAAACLSYSSRILDKTSNGPQFHVRLGLLYDQIGSPGKASEQFRQAMAVDPNYAWAYFYLGVIEERRYHNYGRAIACYRTAHRLSPRNRRIAQAGRQLSRRLAKRNEDISWQLKDWLWSFFLPEGELQSSRR